MSPSRDRLPTPCSPLTPLASSPVTPTVLQSIERDQSPLHDRRPADESPLANHVFDAGAPRPLQPLPWNERDLIYEAEQAEIDRRFHRSSAPTPDLLAAEELGKQLREEAKSSRARLDSSANALLEAVREALEAEDSEDEDTDKEKSSTPPRIDQREFHNRAAPPPDLTAGYDLLHDLYGPAEKHRRKRSASRINASYRKHSPIETSSGRPIRVRNISLKGKESQASPQKQTSQSPKNKGGSKTSSPKKNAEARNQQAGPVNEPPKPKVKASPTVSIEELLVAANSSKKRKVRFEEAEEVEEQVSKKPKEIVSLLEVPSKKRSAELESSQPVGKKAKVKAKIVILKLPISVNSAKPSKGANLEVVKTGIKRVVTKGNKPVTTKSEHAFNTVAKPFTTIKTSAKPSSKKKEVKGRAKKQPQPPSLKKVKASTIDIKPTGKADINNKLNASNGLEPVTSATLEKIEVLPNNEDKMASARIVPKTAAKGADTTKAAPKKAAATKGAEATKAAPKKATPTKAAKAADTKASKNVNGTAPRKRKAEEIEEKKVPAKKVTPAAKKLKVINAAPKDRLKVFVFGEGGNGELGLGAKGNVIDVKRPRLNPFLLPANVGVVQLAAGGMHAAALTHDNRILTWGVNDQGTLGRETKSADQTRDMDAESNDSDEDSDTGLNPLESQPKEIDVENVPTGTTWTKLALGDSVTFAVTDTGLVYGCGTFRSNDGILGFSSDGNVETKFVQVAGLKNIVDISCGSNHALALDDKGGVFAWGSGQQSQLGRRIVERTRLHGLKPTPVAFPRSKIQAIGNGNYHSFAIDTKGEVWAWGLNSFGETGIDYLIGESEAVVVRPEKVPALAGKQVVAISGGAHHSLALTRDGTTLAFGRCDSAQAGLDLATLPKDAVVTDDRGTARLIRRPLPLPDVPASAAMAVGTDSNLVVARSGRAYSWGFSTNYQTGQGITDDIARPTLIDNTATREEKLVWAGAGGQYGMLASRAEK